MIARLVQCNHLEIKPLPKTLSKVMTDNVARLKRYHGLDTSLESTISIYARLRPIKAASTKSTRTAAAFPKD